MKENKISLIEKAGDWRTQGLQLQTAYYDVWSRIKSIFTGYGKVNGVTLNRYNPMLTIETLRDIERASGLAEVLIVNPKIREILSKVYVAKGENYLKGQLFLLLLRIIPKFDRMNSDKALKKWLNKPDGQLQELLGLQGTIKMLDEKSEKIMKRKFK